MRAAVIHEHGGPENLVYEENFPDPECGPEDVVVRVKASSLNYHDIFTRRGMPGIKLNMPVIPGLDVAGEIAEVGSNVSGWSVGDRVLIDPDTARSITPPANLRKLLSELFLNVVPTLTIPSLSYPGTQSVLRHVL